MRQRVQNSVNMQETPSSIAFVFSRIITRALLFGAAILYVGCSFSTDFDRFEKDDVSEISPFVLDLSEAICSYAMRCEAKFDKVKDLQRFCVPQVLEAELSQLAPANLPSVDLSSVGDCLAYWDDPDCESTPPSLLPKACSELLIRPTSSSTIPCKGPLECPSQRCLEPSDQCSIRVCIPSRNLGEECNADANCADDYICANHSGSGLCQLPQEDGSPCLRSAECAKGLYCALNPSVCTPQPTNDGAPCDASDGIDPCGAGLICSGPTGNRTCKSGTVNPGLAPCHSEQPCDLGERCVGGVCRKIVPKGEPCSSDLECPEFHICHENTCAMRPWIGGECDEAQRCLVGTCADGRCQLPAAGEACVSDTLLLGLRCDGASRCDGSVCQLPFGEGVSCRDNNQCSDGLVCNNGTCTSCD